MTASSSTDVTAEPEGPDSRVPISDEGPMRRVQTLAHLMDDVFRIPGTEIRFGFDPIVSVLPVIGSIAGAIVPLYIILEAAVAGVPKTALGKMLAVAAVDTVIGAVPVVGPLADAAWKANVWNVSILEDHLAESDQG